MTLRPGIPFAAATVQPQGRFARSRIVLTIAWIDVATVNSNLSPWLRQEKFAFCRLLSIIRLSLQPSKLASSQIADISSPILTPSWSNEVSRYLTCRGLYDYTHASQHWESPSCLLSLVRSQDGLQLLLRQNPNGRLTSASNRSLPQVPGDRILECTSRETRSKCESRPGRNKGIVD
jgi:hypothetical protein